MIATGDLLIKNGTLLPQPLGLEKDTLAAGWVSAANQVDGSQFEKALTSAGWAFFYMAGSITKRAFGFDKQKMIDAALKSVLAVAKLQKCNCLEIDGIAMHSLLGLPYVSVSAHSRHIQEGMVFAG